MKMNQAGLPQAGGQSAQHLRDGIGKTASGKLLRSKHWVAAAAVRQGIVLPLNILVHSIEFRQVLDYKTTNRSFLRLLHPSQRHVVRVGVEGKGRAERVELALQRAPQQRIALQVEWGAESLSL